MGAQALPREIHAYSPGTCCPQEFSQDSPQLLQPWVIYLSCTSELDRFLTALSSGWKAIYQVPGCSWGGAWPGLKGSGDSNFPTTLDR